MTMDSDKAVDLARECLYRFLAAVLSDPNGSRFPMARETSTSVLALQAAELLQSEAEPPIQSLGCAEIIEYLSGCDDPASEYRNIFGLSATVFPPFESEFFPNQEPFFRAQQLADVAGFYSAFGLKPIRGEAERVDHIALELEFLAYLLARRRMTATTEEREVCEYSAATFFREHVGWWATALARGLEHKGAGGLYEHVGRALAAFIALERRRWPVEPAKIPLPEAVCEQPDEAPGCAACPA